jgi:hypothetical protein
MDHRDDASAGDLVRFVPESTQSPIPMLTVTFDNNSRSSETAARALVAASRAVGLILLESLALSCASLSILSFLL